ncbi:MAG: hypothetical protein HQK91_15190 [Nitrospirae bacterium]|nr:hypothetical protein [Nitrospirota bacterium]
MKKSLILVLAALFLYSCGGVDTKVYKSLDIHLKAHDCSKALDYLAKNEKQYGDNQQLIYRLDNAMVNMECRNFDAGNQFFHSAESLAEDLYTTSISKEAVSYLINDYTIPYGGEDFERALINMFSAINYLMLGKKDEALVECRRLDALLSVYNEKYDKNKNVYKEDAFGRYLSAMIYEASAQYDEAYIDYDKSLSTFRDYNNQYKTPIPVALIEDIMRSASKTGRTAELEAIKKEFPSVQGLNLKQIKNLGKIVFIQLNGQSPVKTSTKIYVPSPSGPITLAFPSYLANPPYCQNTDFFAESGDKFIGSKAELVEDINQIAIKNLQDRKGRLIAKGLTRAAVKELALHAATSSIKDENVKQITRIFGNLLNTQVETADTRSWRTMPGEISMSRIFVPEGNYKLHVQQCKGGKQYLETVDIKKGETKFVLFESIY